MPTLFLALFFELTKTFKTAKWFQIKNTQKNRFPLTNDTFIANLLAILSQNIYA